MRRVFKYDLQVVPTQVVAMPAGARLLSVQVQGLALVLWALVDDQQPPEVRTFAVVGTGHEFDVNKYTYVGTAQQSGGALVWHVFEVLW